MGCEMIQSAPVCINAYLKNILRAKKRVVENISDWIVWIIGNKMYRTDIF